jgi:hypothetical protein
VPVQKTRHRDDYQRDRDQQGAGPEPSRRFGAGARVGDIRDWSGLDIHA